MREKSLNHSILIMEYAFKLLEAKSNEGIQKLSMLRKPDNVVHLKHLNNNDELGLNTLMACQAIPSLILLSLTVEQTLKLLLKQECDKEYKTHELKRLFGKLPAELQFDISNQVVDDLKIDIRKFNDSLAENDSVFVNWRYFYESQTPNTASSGFLKTFQKRLKEKIKNDA